jgi:hypothetical protein
LKFTRHVSISSLVYSDISLIRKGGIIFAMDRKSKILLWVTVIIVLISLFSTFYKIVILQDFEVFESEDNLQVYDEEKLNEEVNYESEVDSFESQY